jgi:hypothetical protein
VSLRRRWSVIAAIAAAVAVAAWIAPEDSKPIERAEAIAAAAQASPASALELPRRRTLRRQRGELFVTPAPPPPPPQQVQVQAPPAPPPNPYRFAGTVEQGGVTRVLLVLGDRVFEAKEGEMLEQNFRVQSVTADAVTLVYVPLEAPISIARVFPGANR